jgi:putative transposase
LGREQDAAYRGCRAPDGDRGPIGFDVVFESFFSTLKHEIIEGETYETREHARAAIFSWIEIWYNRRRRHSTLGYVSAEQFELSQAA